VHFGLLVLASTQRVLSAEEVLKAEGIRVRLVPLPPALSEVCGVGLRFNWEERDAVEQALGGRFQYEVHELA
jgi:hypothetical protein